MTVTSTANIHANPSIRTTSSSPSEGTHEIVSRSTPPSRTHGNRLMTQTAATIDTSPAQLASAVRARVGRSAATALPKNGKSNRATTGTARHCIR